MRRRDEKGKEETEEGEEAKGDTGTKVDFGNKREKGSWRIVDGMWVEVVYGGGKARCGGNAREV